MPTTPDMPAALTWWWARTLAAEPSPQMLRRVRRALERGGVHRLGWEEGQRRLRVWDQSVNRNRTRPTADSLRAIISDDFEVARWEGTSTPGFMP